MSAPDFWDRNESSKQIVKELSVLKDTVEEWRRLNDKFEDIETLYELANEENDTSTLQEVSDSILALEKEVLGLEIKGLLSDKYDKNNAIVCIHPGAGGTESCDWASMLLRMYRRWMEKRRFQVQVLDLIPGEEAGIKSVTLIVKGVFAYGYLKGEKGVHRLVRISPFDANKRRHTSFSSVDVVPELPEEEDVGIEEKDLKIDTYRAGGPGGQHVNVTDSAVRITHLPTGIVVQCQNERSQHQNKMMAMKVLKARLFEKKMKEREEALAKEYGEKKKIEWGSQIRSYVFQPYQMVKDHRTNVEVGNVSAVMDGDIDRFMEAFLKKQAKE